MPVRARATPPLHIIFMGTQSAPSNPSAGSPAPAISRVNKPCVCVCVRVLEEYIFICTRRLTHLSWMQAPGALRRAADVDLAQRLLSAPSSLARMQILYNRTTHSARARWRDCAANPRAPSPAPHGKIRRNLLPLHRGGGGNREALFQCIRKFANRLSEAGGRCSFFLLSLGGAR